MENSYEFNSTEKKGEIEVISEATEEVRREWRARIKGDPVEGFLCIFRAIELLRRLHASKHTLDPLEVEDFAADNYGNLVFSLRKEEKFVSIEGKNANEVLNLKAKVLLALATTSVMETKIDKLMGLSSDKFLEKMKGFVALDYKWETLISSIWDGKREFDSSKFPHKLTQAIEQSHYFRKENGKADPMPAASLH